METFLVTVFRLTLGKQNVKPREGFITAFPTTKREPSDGIQFISSPHVRESRSVIDSGFHAVDSGFQVLDSGFFVS